VLPKEGGKTWCCGSRNFDPRVNNCCIGIGIIPRSRNSLLPEDCTCHDLYKKIYRRYKPDSGMCCGGRFYPIYPGLKEIECCGSTSYDPYTHVCRNGLLVQRTDI
jgi:hypothetical protein